MQPNKNISERRGLEFLWWQNNTLGVLMVKAPIELVSPVISSMLNGVLEIDVFGKQYDPYSSRHHVLSQYRGHDWTIIFDFDVCADATVTKISEQLQSDCIYLITEDVSGCSSYTLFEKGIIVEELHWGTDYTEEFVGIDHKDLLEFVQQKEAQGDPLAANWDPRTWDIYFVDEYHNYKFRSNKYKATIEEIQNEEVFLDKLFQLHDTWLPDWEYFPKMFPTLEGCEELNDLKLCVKENFVRVDVVFKAKTVNEVWAEFDDHS
jgi:hypothetical protein